MKKGELVMLEQGEFSDRSYIALARSLTDASLADLLAQFRAATAEIDERERQAEQFVAWLIAGRHIEEVEFRPVSLGNYWLYLDEGES